MRNFQGFSIIELIIVIVLLGIVSVVVVPRFLSPGSLGAIAARDSLIATIRSAQQSALGRPTVTFEIATAGNEWVFAARSAGNTIRLFEVASSNVKLETGSAAASTDTCASGAGFNTPVAADFALAFDSLGNLEEFTNDGTIQTVDANFNGVRICVNDTVEMSVCVSPAGYAHAGNCDD